MDPRTDSPSDRITEPEWLRELSARSVDVYQIIVDSLAEGVGIVDDTETIRFANPAFARISGYDVAELHGMHLTRLIPPENFAAIEAQTQLRRDGESSVYDTVFIRADGVRRIIRVHARPLEGSVVPFSGTLGVIDDVTERVQTAERFRVLTEQAHDIIAEFGPDLRARYVSPGTEAVLGYTMAEMDALLLEDLVAPEDLQMVRDQVASDVQERLEHCTLTVRVRRKLGEPVMLELGMSYIFGAAGELERIVVVMRDVTARVRAHREIERQRSEIETLLREKELLLREVHHRVKNDLTLVTSLLQLQAGTTPDADTQAHLTEAGRRVQTIATVYERLYQAEQLDHVDLRELLQQLLVELRSSILRPSVDLLMDGEPLTVSPRIGVAVATIVNELIANSLKHGDQDLGLIRVSWHASGPRDLIVQVADDGPGFSAEQLESNDGGGYGLTIVRALAGQWQGSVTTSNNDGALVEVRLLRPETD